VAATYPDRRRLFLIVPGDPRKFTPRWKRRDGENETHRVPARSSGYHPDHHHRHGVSRGFIITRSAWRGLESLSRPSSNRLYHHVCVLPARSRDSWRSILTTKMLALAFLVLIGVALVAEPVSVHIPRGYIYFAIAFSAAVEASTGSPQSQP